MEEGVVINYPDSVGRDSSQKRWPRVSTAEPPRRLSEPETTSEVMGDFHEPYGAVSFSSVGVEGEGEGEGEAIRFQ